jgi:hypothetical protein
LVIPASSHSLGSAPPPASTNVTANVPTEALKELFPSQLAEFCSEAALEQLIQFLTILLTLSGERQKRIKQCFS